MGFTQTTSKRLSPLLQPNLQPFDAHILAVTEFQYPSCGGCYTVRCKFLTNGLLRHTVQDKNTQKHSKNSAEKTLQDGCYRTQKLKTVKKLWQFQCSTFRVAPKILCGVTYIALRPLQLFFQLCFLPDTPAHTPLLFCSTF